MLARRYSAEASRVRKVYGGASVKACNNVSSHAFVHAALHENRMLQTPGDLALYAELAPTQELRDLAVQLLQTIGDPGCGV
jgi:hypothetical protein